MEELLVWREAGASGSQYRRPGLGTFLSKPKQHQLMERH